MLSALSAPFPLRVCIVNASERALDRSAALTLGCPRAHLREEPPIKEVLLLKRYHQGRDPDERPPLSERSLRAAKPERRSRDRSRARPLRPHRACLRYS